MNRAMRRHGRVFLVMWFGMFCLDHSLEAGNRNSNLRQVVIVPPDSIRDFGASLAVGDLNGDGFDELIVGCPCWDPDYRPEGGAVFVIYGTAQWPDTLDLRRSDRLYSVLEGPSDSDFGSSLFLGDCNGNGIDDLLVGAPKTGPDDFHQYGAVFVFDGKPGYWPSRIPYQDNPADITILGAEAGQLLGQSLCLGDINGDGLEDICLGSPGMVRNDATQNLTGGSIILFQKVGGFPSVIDMATYTGPKTKIFGKTDNDLCGWSIAAGDLNRDGVDDVLIGAYKANTRIRDEGEVYLVLGSDTIPAFIYTGYGSKITEFRGSEFPEHMGYKVLCGDLNHDGRVDGIMGSRQASNGPIPITGRIRVFWGKDDYPAVVEYAEETPDLEILGGIPYGQFGSALAVLDMDGDSFVDLAVGNPVPLIAQQTDSGSVEIFRGRLEWSSPIDLAVGSSDRKITGFEIGDWFGFALASGDLDADGIGDLVVGAPKAFANGRIKVVFGSGNTSIGHDRSVSFRSEAACLSIHPNPFNEEAMIAITVPGSASGGHSSQEKGVRLEIRDCFGRMIRQWEIGSWVDGETVIRWDGRDSENRMVPSGMYIAVAKIPDRMESKKMVLVR